MENQEATLLDEVTQEQALDTVGPSVLKEVQQLKEEFEDHDTGWKARYAPSIVTRSEAEVFGMSVPRFAVRVYIDPKMRYFANLRRLKTFCDFSPSLTVRRFIPDHLQRRDLIERPDFRETSNPSEILLNQSCIADAFLPIPQSLQHFSIIKTQLAAAYGETFDVADKYSGSVYLKHIALAGGGLCAQAVCFMAAAHLHGFAESIQGLLEITHYATNVDLRTYELKKLELILDGLDFKGMTNYLKVAGLNAILQRAHCLKPVALSAAKYDLFPDAAKAYLLSDMPVVLPVDCERMAGSFRNYIPEGLSITDIGSRKPIYGMLSVDQVSKIIQSFPFNRHAILLVGANPQPGQDDFVFHDPLAKPFMTASALDLVLAAAYTDRLEVVAGAVQDPLGGPATTARVFLPVTPAQVRMPVINTTKEDDYGATIAPAEGIINIALRIQGLMDARFGIPVLKAPPNRTTQFKLLRLIPAAKIQETIRSFAESPFHYLADAPHKLSKLLEVIATSQVKLYGVLTRGSAHWVWLQCLQDSVWVWDAECTPVPAYDRDTLDQKRGFLRLALSCEEGSWSQPRHFDPDSANNRYEINRNVLSGVSLPTTSAERKHPVVSVITSVSARGINQALRAWPFKSDEAGETGFADLYAFMQPDASDYLDPGHTSSKSSAVELMSNLHNDDEAIHQVAMKLSERFLAGPASGRNVKVAAIASFVPELVCDDSDRATTGIQALMFLVKLSRELQLLKHPAKTLELVSGSMSCGIWPAEQIRRSSVTELEEFSVDRVLNANRAAVTFAASILSKDEAFERLVNGLHRVSDVIQQIEQRDRIPQWFTLSLEMEPGPLYTLGQDRWGTIDRMLEFCNILKTDDLLCPRVGFNLDIPHWSFLGGIKPSQLTETDLFYRITHAHISDHGKGHFSDAVPGVCHDDNAFAEWIALIGRRIETDEEAIKRGFPSFSGFVALELEASKWPKHVRVSFDKVVKLVS